MFQIVGVTSKRSGLVAFTLVLAWCLGSIVYFGPPFDGWLQLRSPVLTPPFSQEHPMNEMRAPIIDPLYPHPFSESETNSGPPGCIRLHQLGAHDSTEVPFCRTDLPERWIAALAHGPRPEKEPIRGGLISGVADATDDGEQQEP